MPPARSRAGGPLPTLDIAGRSPFYADALERQMDLIDTVRDHALALPLMAKFALGMALIVFVPQLFRALGLPGVVGLLLSGILFGPHGLDVFGAHPLIADFFSELGKLLLMFFAGLEIDLDVLKRSQNRSIVFGLATTLIPLTTGTLVGLIFGYAAIPAIVIGSLLASHTLLGLAIVRDLGQSNREPMTVTVGATVISDTLSLIIFAVCVTSFCSGFTLSSLGLQLIQIAGFAAVILFGLRHAGGFLLRQMEQQEEAYVVILLGLLAVAGVLAELIGLPGIVGAFLAGLALNSAVKERPATSKLSFLGKTLFIPSFFVVTGFLISPMALVHSLIGQFPLVMGVLLALLAGKAAATELVGRAFGYSRAERLTMWSLTLPQVAATLAATLVAHATVNAAGEPLLDAPMLNVVLVLVLVTSVLGPLLTARFAPRMAPGAGIP
jgi:Kef-type K+ transport system membrane component KefB